MKRRTRKKVGIAVMSGITLVSYLLILLAGHYLNKAGLQAAIALAVVYALVCIPIFYAFKDFNYLIVKGFFWGSGLIFVFLLFMGSLVVLINP